MITEQNYLQFISVDTSIIEDHASGIEGDIFSKSESDGSFVFISVCTGDRAEIRSMHAARNDTCDNCGSQRKAQEI